MGGGIQQFLEGTLVGGGIQQFFEGTLVGGENIGVRWNQTKNKLGARQG